MTVLLVSLATFTSTLLGGLFAIKLKDKLHLILGFSAGAVVGVALFDLLPESIEISGHGINTVMLFIACGFVFYMIVDRFIASHCHETNCGNDNHNNGRLGAGTLIFHSLLDGLGIGLAFKVSPLIGAVVAAAVLTHDFSDGINTVAMIVKNNGQRKEAMKWLLADAIAPVIGVVLASFTTVSQPTLGLILAVFAGMFLYIGSCDLIPESHHQHPQALTTILTIAGLLAIFLAVHFLSLIHI